jgi:AraC family transcriptional regulator
MALSARKWKGSMPGRFIDDERGGTGMKDENAFHAMSPVMIRHVDRAAGSISASHPNSSLSSIESASARVGHLVMRAMEFFESNREVAWRCLRDASSLLGGEPETMGIEEPRLQSTLRPGGLAAWQANRALEYIEDNCGSKIGIQEMAECVALSKSHFSRAFRHSLGCSPMAYVVALRVERAKLMMTSTRQRLTEIALACGFSDQSHLTRSFSRIVGLSPARWRRLSMPRSACRALAPKVADARAICGGVRP